MTSILLPLLLAVAVRAAPAHAHAHACQALREYDALASTVTREFYDRTFRRLDWNARVLRYRARVRCGFDASDVASTVNALLSALHASHTAVYTAKDLKYWALESLFSQSTYVAGREFVPPGIGSLEGIGVQPDVAVKPCLRFCRGSDPQLSAALRMIRTAPSSRAAALVWRPGPFRFGHRRRRGRLCDLDARSCLRFAPPPRPCLLALSSSPQTPSCWALGRLYQIERGARRGAWGLSFNPIAISVLQRSR